MKLITPREHEAPRVSTVRLIPDPTTPAEQAQPSARMALPAPLGSPPPLSSLAGLRTEINLLPDSSGWAGGAAHEATSADTDAPQSFGRVGLDGAAHLPAGPASGPQRLAAIPGREVLRGSLANPAVMDPRSNSPRPSMEEKIALSLNPELCLKEERMPDGTIRRALVKRKEVPSAAQAYTGIKTMRVMVCQ
ncbi:hypothetical protein [Roseateles sp. YR242]|uniref:hypothetical protein n=1 Tax=Roseateles sp. YR242 TaxID=1855305 RepID=UPI00116078C5|nr:hypothetical protein [Roseateles sp. YR242]